MAVGQNLQTAEIVQRRWRMYLKIERAELKQKVFATLGSYALAFHCHAHHVHDFSQPEGGNMKRAPPDRPIQCFFGARRRLVLATPLHAGGDIEDETLVSTMIKPTDYSTRRGQE